MGGGRWRMEWNGFVGAVEVGRRRRLPFAEVSTPNGRTNCFFFLGGKSVLKLQIQKLIQPYRNSHLS